MADWIQSITDWLWPTFDPNRCKLYLKSAVVRMNLKKKKGLEQNKQAEKGISELVKQEKEDLARLKVEQLVREQRLLEAYDVLELFCEIVATRIQLIHMYPDIPDDMKEAVYTLTWASLRVAIPELKHLSNQFKLKYGEEFLKAALDNTHGYVNEELMEKLSICCTDKDAIEEEYFRISPVPDKISQKELESFGQSAMPSVPSVGLMPPTSDQAHYQQQIPFQAPAIVGQQPTIPFVPPAALLPPASSTTSFSVQNPVLPNSHQGATGLPPSSSSASFLPYPHQATSGSAPLPYVAPDLDFGDWSSPLPAPAYPHQADSELNPALDALQLQFPLIPSDNPDGIPSASSEAPFDPTEQEFAELSARFEALRKAP